MTIVSDPDTRNSSWANDKSAFGQRMLMKMGWSEGKGLGKNQQGTNSSLRAIRREEGLGIGAKTDKYGDDGFSKTSTNFHGVLAILHAEHGTGANASEKSKKKKDKSKKLEKKESSLTLSKNKVTAGHAKKMRESKDLTKKSKEDMAAIFGMKVEQYQSNSVWARLSTLSSSTLSSDKETNDANKDKSSESDGDEKKIRKEKKKRKRKEDQDSCKSEEIDCKNESEKKSKKSKKRRKDQDS